MLLLPRRMKKWGSGHSFTPSEEGTYTATVSVSDGKFAPVTRTTQFQVVQGPYDFVLGSVEVAQATIDPLIWHTDGYDLVSGKDTVVLAYVGKNRTIKADDITDIPVKAVFTDQNGAQVSFYGSFKANALDPTKPVELNHFGSFSVMGSGTIEVEVNPVGGIPGIPGGTGGAVAGVDEVNREDNKISNTNAKKKFYAYITSKLNLNFVRIDPPCDSCYSEVSDGSFLATKNNALKYVRAAFPIAKTGLSADTDTAVEGVEREDGLQPGARDLAMLYDMIKLDSTYANLLSPNYERFIGVVGKPFAGIPGYFNYHGMTSETGGNVMGVAPWAAPRVALVDQDGLVIVAHELGHTLGMRDTHASEGGISGYWVDVADAANRGFRLPGTSSFMTAVVPRAEAERFDRRWIDEVTYKNIFSRLAFFLKRGARSESAETVHLNGTITKSGNLTVLNAFHKGATESSEERGDGLISLRDPNGKVISEFNFESSTKLDIMTEVDSSEPPTVEAAVAPFSIDVPFTEALQEIKISTKGAATTVQPHGLLLRKAIMYVADRGLASPADDTRNMLLGLVGQVELGFNEKNYAKAFVTLEHQLRPAVEQGVFDYAQVTPLEYTKTQVLALIDSILGKQAALKTIRPNPQNAFVKVSLDKESYVAGERSGIVGRLIKRPKSPEDELVVKHFIDGVYQKSTANADKMQWSAQSIRLNGGMHVWGVAVYIRNARQARVFEESISTLDFQREQLLKERVRETDPEKIANLDSQIHNLEQQIPFLELKLKELEQEVGSRLEVPLWVN